MFTLIISRRFESYEIICCYDQKKERSPEGSKEALELKGILMEGYDRYQQGDPRNATAEYSKALKLINKHTLKVRYQSKSGCKSEQPKLLLFTSEYKRYH